MLIVAFAVAAAPASAHYKPRGTDCGHIVFTPQTDEGSSEIRAKGTSCKTARKLVRAWHRGNKSPLDFNCRSREHDHPSQLAHNDVLCTRGERRVTFAAY